jgi:hypothetical protein
LKLAAIAVSPFHARGLIFVRRFSVPFSPTLATNMLSWCLAPTTTNPTRPTAPLQLALCTGSPSFDDIRECADPGYSRANISYPEATVTTDGTAMSQNDARVSWGSFVNGQAFYGCALFDASGNLIGIENLQAVVLVAAGQPTHMIASAWPAFLE